MTKKINNKGLTAVELIICFALVSIITIAMFSAVNSYRDKENKESFKNTVTTYKNTLTKTIYDDIIANNGIAEITTEENVETEMNFETTCTLTLTNGKTATVKIISETKCNTKNENENDADCLNIDYEKSTYYVIYTDSLGNKEKFELPKMQGLRFNKVSAELKTDGFIIIHIGLFHNDYGTQYDALNILVPSSKEYPGMF